MSHCVFLFPLVFVVLPRPRGRDGKFRYGSAVRQLLGFGVPADESDNRKLIEVHVCFSLSARLPGHPEASGGCSQTR